MDRPNTDIPVTMRAFRAIDEPETCQKYIEGHVKILHDFGVTKITSNRLEWTTNPSIYGVVAERGGEMVGGIRVHIADGQLPLPIETAIGHMDQRVHELIDGYKDDGGVGELCGLWNSKNVAGMGISVRLTRAGISIINQLEFKTLVGICADYTMQMFQRVGFVVNPDLGIKGEFAYPDPRYITRVLGIMNAETLETAHPEDKESMLDLRAHPVQKREEVGKFGPFVIDYDVVLPQG